jgi:hypothetical protein
MAEQASSANWNAEMPQLGMPALWRLAAWGGIATFALFAAALSAYSNAGSLRQAAASASSGPVTSGQGPLQSRIPAGEFGPRPSETAEETRRLAEAVRALAADRDRALSRIAVLERNLDGVTGTIKRDRVASAQPTAAPTPPQSPPPVAAPATSAAPVAGAAPVASATPVARPELPAARPETQVARPETPAAPVAEIATTTLPAPASQQFGPGDAAPDASNRAVASASAVRTGAPPEPPLAAAAGLGVDVGGAANYVGLRALWHATKNADPAMLEDLYPVVTVRENGKTHGVELRLVVGPIADVDTASRLCTTLSAAKHYCQPVSFEGQRLSVTDSPTPKAVPTKAAPSHHSAATPEPPQNPKSLSWK